MALISTTAARSRNTTRCARSSRRWVSLVSPTGRRSTPGTRRSIGFSPQSRTTKPIAPTISSRRCSTSRKSSCSRPALPPPLLLLPVHDILVFAGAARRVVGAEAVKVELAVLAGDAVVVRVPPRIDGDGFLFQIGSLPAIEPDRLFDQRRQPFLLRRVAAEIDPEQIERRFEVMDVDPGDIG